MAKRWVGRIAAVLKLLAVGLLGAAALSGGCIALLGWGIGSVFDGMCGEDTLYQVWSPDRRYVAGVFRRDCGVATSGLTRHVNLSSGRHPFPATIEGRLEQGRVYIDSRGGLPAVRWKDNTHLVIWAMLSNPESRKTRWRDVTITYEPVPLEIQHRRTGKVIRMAPNFWGVDLRSALLSGADLSRQELTRGDLRGAQLRYAYLESAWLESANLRGADLTGATLTYATLKGADLTGARLTGADLAGAYYDAHTLWPDGFDPRQHGAKLVDW